MLIKVVLRDYLAQLRDEEQKKPFHDRRVIPTVGEFAQAAEVSRTAFINFMNNDNRGMNRDMLGTAIRLLHGRGFDVEVGDLVVYGVFDDEPTSSDTADDEDISVGPRPILHKT